MTLALTEKKRHFLLKRISLSLGNLDWSAGFNEKENRITRFIFIARIPVEYWWYLSLFLLLAMFINLLLMLIIVVRRRKKEGKKERKTRSNWLHPCKISDKQLSDRTDACQVLLNAWLTQSLVQTLVLTVVDELINKTHLISVLLILIDLFFGWKKNRSEFHDVKSRTS